MPKWIRKLIKIDSSLIVECDYACLHPNIVVSIYNGKQEFITHQQIASKTGIDEDQIKLEHLSFFNKNTWQMKNSILFDYYNCIEKQMIEKIIQEKRSSKFKHKVTSRKLFEKEVQIMTNVVKKLNIKGIYVGYIYDAFFCSQDDASIVEEIMNQVVLECGVKTIAKNSSSKIQQIEISHKAIKKVYYDTISYDDDYKNEIAGTNVNYEIINFEFPTGKILQEKVHSFVDKNGITRYMPERFVLGQCFFG
jgi:hypothetical protein